jgi:hypothetical protein
MSELFISPQCGAAAHVAEDSEVASPAVHTTEPPKSVRRGAEQTVPLIAEIERVYFFNCQGANAIKIGRSDDPTARLAACQTGCPLPLTLLGSIPGRLSTERELHARFASLRIHGEWFRAETELVEFIGEALARRPDDCAGSRLNVTFEHQGSYRTLEEWCRRLRLSDLAVLGLMVDGLSFAEAIRHPRAKRAVTRKTGSHG